MLKDRIDFSLIDKYYSTDNIINGRLIKKFFRDLINNVVEQSETYYKDYEKILGKDHGDTLPFCYNEIINYSQFAVSLNQITKIHLSEFPFRKHHKNNIEEEYDTIRKLDFWCAVKEGARGKAINYFIELKTSYFCVDSSKGTLTTTAKQRLDSLIGQVTDMKKIKPPWDGDDNVYMGIMTFHGYKSKTKNEKGYEDLYSPAYLLDAVKTNIDGRKKPQLLYSYIELPEKLQNQWSWQENDICKFVSFVGIIL